jgi:hypothetical protein
VISSGAAGFMSGADKALLDSNLPSASEKAALAGSFGAPGAGNKYVTELDPEHLPPGQVIDVAVSGRAFTSVAAALASITDATSVKPYVVRVFPGVYTESPFALKAYVAVVGQGSWFDVVLTTDDNNANFIATAAGAVLENVAIVGPTGAGYAAVDAQHTGSTPAFLADVVIRKGYYGIWMHPASSGTMHCHNVVNQYAGTALNQFVRVTNGNVTAIGCAFMSGPPASVVTGFYVSGASSTLTMDVCSFRNLSSTDAVFVDSGGLVRMNACAFSAGTNAIHIGATGSGSVVDASGCSIGDNFTKDLWVETASASLSYTGTGHLSKTVVQTGANFTGTVTDTTPGSTSMAVYGDVLLGGQFPLSKFAEAYTTTGVVSGGQVERVSGLQVKVKAGTGFTVASGSLTYISWADQTITLPAGQSSIWIYLDSAGVATSGNTAPDITASLYVARASTSATAVRFLASSQVYIPQPAARLYDYVSEVIGPISVSGSVTSKHAPTSLQLDVTSGVYYSHNVEKLPAASAAPCSFTYWYKDGSGGWTTVASQTSIDTANYDNGSGTLATIPAGRYKRDLLFVAVNDSATEYHVVYGQETFAAAVDATTNPLPPSVHLNESCRLAALVVLQGAADIALVIDQRPKLGQLSSGSTGVTNHGDLSGLGDDDHTQYQLRTEKGAASGYAGLNASSKIAVANLDTATSAPGVVAQGAAAVGAGPKLAFEDHNHSLSVGSPVALTVGGANTDGAATSAARSDHQHALPAFGSSAGTFAQGNDVRLSDDRTASALRTASTVVSVSAAAAPTAGQVLTATSDAAATWQTPTASSSVLVQTAAANITANTTTTQSSFQDLLTVNITAAGAGFFCIFASGAVSNSTANIAMRLRVLVDGVSIGGVQLRSPATGNIAMAFSFNKRVAVGAGTRVVKLQWATVSNTMQCRPIANPDAESASLLVQEVTA